MKSVMARVAFGATLLLTQALPGLAQKQPHAFLKSVGGFDDGALERLDRGEVVTRKLETGVSNELALLGAARMEGTIEAFLPLYRNIETFEKELGPAKKLSEPPKLPDFDEVALPKSELNALSNCEIGDCDIHVSEQTLSELRSRIDWSKPDADQAVLRYVRERIQEYAEAYQTGGNARLSVYRNKAQPTAVADEFAKLLETSPYVLRYLPELHRYLLEYPKATLPRAEDFLYWSIVGFGPKPTLRLNHVTIYPSEKGANQLTIVTSKQLYYSRYFDTGLELYTLFGDEARPGDGFYLVALNRYRTDLGGGMTGKIMKVGAAAGTEGAMKKTIENAQAAMKKLSAGTD